MSPSRGGYKLIDLMVIVLVSALLMALIPAWVHNGQIGGRRTQCANNMRQIGLALLNFSTTQNRFPSAGTFRDDPAVHQGDPAKSNIYLSIADPGKLPD